MKFAVEAWAPEYGSSVDVGDLVQSSAAVDIDVEHDAGEWHPLTPERGGERPGSVAFIDGIRRVDARVWITDGDGTSRPGLCASVAAGLVRSDGERAEVVDRAVHRGLYTAVEDGQDIASRHARYELCGVGDDTPEQAYLGIHKVMTELEIEMSADVADCDLVLFDGPLRGRATSGAVGFVKSQHRAYLEGDEQRVLTVLEPGQRTPLFRITGQFARLSWYVRLPGEPAHPLAGIVRCETADPGGASTAATGALADLVTRELQRFASHPHKDTRAPQNLYPVAGLERDLRRHLGDAQILERALREAARL